ncbi:hypothetical protein KI387_000895, partial [Taxus chinensis]
MKKVEGVAYHNEEDDMLCAPKKGSIKKKVVTRKKNIDIMSPITNEEEEDLSEENFEERKICNSQRKND